MIESFFWRKLVVKTGMARLIPSLVQSIPRELDHLELYSDRTLSLPYSELHDSALLPDISTPGSINFALGNPRCDLHSSMPRIVTDCRPDFWGDSALRQELAERFHVDHGQAVDSDQEFLITPGGASTFASTLDALINPGDRVVLFDPTSPIFPLGLKHRRARIHWVPTWSDEGRMRFPMDVFSKAIRGAKMVVLGDPVNPTGCLMTPEDLEQIAFWAQKVEAIIYLDSSFDRWREERPRVRLAQLPNGTGRVITAGSFAKSHGLTSARVGWVSGPKHLLNPIAGASLLNGNSVAPVCQQMALTALRIGDPALQSIRDDLNARRHYVFERLLGMGLKPTTAKGGFFLWVPVPTQETSHAFAQRLLGETGVLVNPGHVFGPSGKNFFRLSFAIDEGRLREGLARLEAFLNPPPVAKLLEEPIPETISMENVTR